MKSAKEYMNEVYQAALHHFGNRNNPVNYLEYTNTYIGEEGALRLAREFGYGLKDYAEKERMDIVQNSYSTLCVRLYNLKPPISAKEWNEEIMKMWEG